MSGVLASASRAFSNVETRGVVTLVAMNQKTWDALQGQRHFNFEGDRCLWTATVQIDESRIDGLVVPLRYDNGDGCGPRPVPKELLQ